MAMPLLLRRRRHRTLWRCLETKNGSSCIEMKRLRLLSKFATSSWRSDPQPRQGCFQRNISDPAAAKHRGQRCILLLRGFYSSTSKIDKEKFKETATSDPPVWTWVDHVLPSSLRPYARLARMDKPIGTMLLVR